MRTGPAVTVGVALVAGAAGVLVVAGDLAESNAPRDCRAGEHLGALLGCGPVQIMARTRGRV